MLQNARLFGVDQMQVEQAIVGLDAGKVVLEDMAGSLNASAVAGVGNEDSRNVKHKVGTAAYALVKSMKEFCDILGV